MQTLHLIFAKLQAILTKIGSLQPAEVFFADEPEEEKIEDVKKIEVKANDFDLEREKFNNSWGVQKVSNLY